MNLGNRFMHGCTFGAAAIGLGMLSLNAEAGWPEGDALMTRVAFGACAPQQTPTPIFRTIAEAEPDLFIFAGDTIYPDVNDEGTGMIEPWPSENILQRIQDSYSAQSRKPEYQDLLKRVPVTGTWDDHDYGVNDGSADFSLKEETETMFLNFFDVPPDSPSRKRLGVYDAAILGPEGRRVQILLLDLRYFRTPPVLDTRSAEVKQELNIIGKYAPSTRPEDTILGKVQWAWLEEQLKIPAEVRLLVSTYPLIANEMGGDSWANFPAERQRLFHTIENTGAEGVVILSGDVHFSELSMTEEGPYVLHELTVGPLCGYKAGYEKYRNSRRVAGPVTEYNFGMVEIDWEDGPSLRLKTIDEAGQTRIEKAIPLNELQ